MERSLPQVGQDHASWRLAGGSIPEILAGWIPGRGSLSV